MNRGTWDDRDLRQMREDYDERETETDKGKLKFLSTDNKKRKRKKLFFFFLSFFSYYLIDVDIQFQPRTLPADTRMVKCSNNNV